MEMGAARPGLQRSYQSCLPFRKLSFALRDAQLGRVRFGIQASGSLAVRQNQLRLGSPLAYLLLPCLPAFLQFAVATRLLPSPPHSFTYLPPRTPVWLVYLYKHFTAPGTLSSS